MVEGPVDAPEAQSQRVELDVVAKCVLDVGAAAATRLLLCQRFHRFRDDADVSRVEEVGCLLQVEAIAALKYREHRRLLVNLRQVPGGLAVVVQD